MRRKTQDPALVRLLDQQAAAAEKAERGYRRLKRAFTALEKVRWQLRSLARRIGKETGGGETVYG